jgi:hypothetical protein
MTWVLLNQRPLPLDGAALVRKVRENQAWIDSTASFSVRFEAKRTRSQEAIQRARNEFLKTHGGAEPNSKGNQWLQQELTGQLEIAFDTNRFYRSMTWTNVSREAQMWNGVLAVQHSRTADDEAGRFVLRLTPDGITAIP